MTLPKCGDCDLPGFWRIRIRDAVSSCYACDKHMEYWRDKKGLDRIEKS